MELDSFLTKEEFTKILTECNSKFNPVRDFLHPAMKAFFPPLKEFEVQNSSKKVGRYQDNGKGPIRNQNLIFWPLTNVL